MKCCIIQNDNRSGSNFFEKTVLKPKFKQNAIGRPAVFQWRNPLALANPGNDVDALEFSAAYFGNNLLPAGRSRILSIETAVNSRFVYIHKAFRSYCFQLFYKLLSNTFVTFLVQSSFFYAIFLIVSMP